MEGGLPLTTRAAHGKRSRRARSAKTALGFKRVSERESFAYLSTSTCKSDRDDRSCLHELARVWAAASPPVPATVCLTFGRSSMNVGERSC